jgi:hypothetical protein
LNQITHLGAIYLIQRSLFTKSAEEPKVVQQFAPFGIPPPTLKGAVTGGDLRRRLPAIPQRM